MYTYSFSTFVTVTDLDVLPLCKFKPLYALPRIVKQYQGVNQVHASKVYPKDDTWLHTRHKPDKCNNEINKNVCESVIEIYSLVSMHANFPASLHVVAHFLNVMT